MMRAVTNSQEQGNFPLRVAKEYPEVVRNTERLGAMASEMLSPIRTNPYERGLKFLACAVASGHCALALLATNGHGAEAVTVGRGMFETFLTFRYLILRPEEFKDFLDFDKVARWMRLQNYKDRHDQAYKSFSREKLESVEKEFNEVKERFTTSRGKVVAHWTRKSIAEMADAVGEKDMYEVFYRYACSLSHVDPMGLTMLVDGKSFEVPLGPTWEHVGIALWVSNYLTYRTLFQYDYLLKLGFDEHLREIEQCINEFPVTAGGTPLGWFQEALMPQSA
jgi:hypothetical protein